MFSSVEILFAQFLNTALIFAAETKQSISFEISTATSFTSQDSEVSVTNHDQATKTVSREPKQLSGNQIYKQAIDSNIGTPGDTEKID